MPNVQTKDIKLDVSGHLGVERISNYYNVYCYRVMQLSSTDSKGDDGGSLLDHHTFITTPVRILVCHSQTPGA